MIKTTQPSVRQQRTTPGNPYLAIDGSIYALAEEGSGYAKKVLIDHFLEHVQVKAPPPPELLEFIAQFLISVKPSIQNKKGYHENRWEAWINACDVQACVDSGEATSLEAAFSIVAHRQSKEKNKSVSEDAIKKHWQRFGERVRKDELPSFGELGEIPIKGKKM